ncbi:hypothetical protein RB195_012922 [Necator americanus]|uniref:Uncharacterized protein n=1 Tax=Necator americanus TaxID=51031 RepID=A0ABR1DTF6_NECAM
MSTRSSTCNQYYNNGHQHHQQPLINPLSFLDWRSIRSEELRSAHQKRREAHKRYDFCPMNQCYLFPITNMERRFRAIIPMFANPNKWADDAAAAAAAASTSQYPTVTFIGSRDAPRAEDNGIPK